MPDKTRLGWEFNSWTVLYEAVKTQLTLASNGCLKPVLFSPRKVLVLENPRGPIYKSLSLDLKSLSLDHKSLSLSSFLDHKVFENCQGLRILKTVRYVSREVHNFRYRHRVLCYGEEWLTYLYQILFTDIFWRSALVYLVRKKIIYETN